MNILIIDDEPITVQMLTKKIPWREIAIENVYTAYDSAFARQIVQTFPIHIILCDIEMPGESGIDFLRWLKEHSFMPVVTILLTCHDDFSYAREGISLGVLEYVLKPVPFDDLTEILKKAVKEYRKRHRAQLNMQDSELWQKHKPSVIRNYWKDYFSKSSPDSEITGEELGFERDTAYVLIIFYQGKPSSLNSADIILLLEQQAESVFSILDAKYVLFSPRENYFYVLSWMSPGEKDPEIISYLFKQFQAFLRKLHMNQIHLTGCMNSFCDFTELLLEQRSFLSFLENQSPQMGMFLTDRSSILSEQFARISNTHLIEDIADYVHRHLSQEITRSDIADYVHLNVDYLNRIFKKETGMTLVKYIRQERLDYARYLLRNTELSISEIAVSTGFTTPSHFSSSFHKEFGYTPIDYKNKRFL
ncbi:MAG: helix-turn-helix domain-containing protein [Clostridiales bacterium]|nr:helix-turn-helix domain-containing protein [Clostridiales bacterium]